MKKEIISLLAGIILLSGCAADTAQKTETQTPPTKEREEIATEETVEYTSYLSGEYRNEYVEVVFDKNSFVLLEENSEDASDYFLSIVPAQGDPNAFPRIDVFAMDVSALTVESVAEMGEEAAREDFGEFCRYLLLSYYPSILTEDGEALAEAEITQKSLVFEIAAEEKRGAAEFSVAENAYYGTPDMYAKIELIGGETDGMMKIMLYPEFMPETEKEQMQKQMQGIRFLGT